MASFFRRSGSPGRFRLTTPGERLTEGAKAAIEAVDQLKNRQLPRQPAAGSTHPPGRSTEFTAAIAVPQAGTVAF